jgi:uncharacterized membrane protein YdjX (TVP38/TMEM64 family)
MRGYKTLVVYAAAVLFLSLAYFVSPLSREAVWQLFPGLEAMAHANPFVTVLTFLIASAILAFFAFPSMPMICMAAGFYVNGLGGGATVLLGSVFGGLSAFLFYRQHIQRPGAFGHEKSPVKIWLTLLGLRLSPFVPAPLVNFFAAVFDVSPLQYLTSSVLGNAPLVLFYAEIGQQGRHFLSSGTAHWYEIAVYLIILTMSTLLSVLGPWRSMLSQLKVLKDSSGSNALSLNAAPGM